MNPGMHSTFLTVIGAYFLYIAYQLATEGSNGSGGMSAPVAILFTVFFALAGLGVLFYAARLWRRSKQESPQDASESDDSASNSEQNDSTPFK